MYQFIIYRAFKKSAEEEVFYISHVYIGPKSRCEAEAEKYLSEIENDYHYSEWNFWHRVIKQIIE